MGAGQPPTWRRISIIREGHLATVGNLLKFATPWTARVQRDLSRQPLEELIAKLRSGPPRWSPMALPTVDVSANTLEFFVHHEDVRRAQPNWRPRELATPDLEQLWAASTKRARLFLRHAPVSVKVQWPGHGEVLIPRSGEPTSDPVSVVGDPAEVTMYLHGRRSHALVDIVGDPTSVQALADTNLAV